MSKSALKIQIFYEIAMSIGNSLDLQKMLKHSLLTYLRKLNCTAGVVYNTRPAKKDQLPIEKIFSIPYTLNIKESYNEIERIFSNPFTQNSLQKFTNQLPISGITADKQYYHILKLGDYGFLVLIRNSSHLDDEVLMILEEINAKLAQSCIACENNRILKENEEKAQKIGDSALDAVIMIDPLGIVNYWNKSAEKMFGYTVDEILGKDIHSFIMPPKYRENFQKGWEKFKVTGTGYAIGKILQLTSLRKSGEEFPIELALSSIHMKNGFGAMAYIRDISAKHEAQMLLVESEKRLQQYSNRLELALLGSEAGLWDWNIETNEVYFSERWFEMLGYEQSEIEPNFSSREKLIHPEDLTLVQSNLNQHMEGITTVYKTEYRVKTKSGDWLWILDTGKVIQRNETGEAIRAAGTYIDISAKKRNEFKLQQNLIQQELQSEIALELNALRGFKNRINSALDKIGNHTKVSRTYIFENDKTGKTASNTFEWCNENIESYKELTPTINYETSPSWKNILLKQGFIYSENIADFPDDIRTILEPRKTKSIVVYPLYVQEKFYGFLGIEESTKQKNWSKSELELLRSLSGVISSAYERRLMEYSIIAERDKANQANKAKSEFLANMSHEIRTPMNAILGFSEALYYKLESAEHKKMINSVVSSGNLLLSLLNDILDLSKIEAGKLEISPQPIDLKNILQEIKLLFDNKAQKKGIDIKIEVPESFPEIIRLDEIRIKQVIFNLVGNAIKFTHKGHIQIGLNYIPNDIQKGEIQLAVQDTGIGIPKSQQKHIFEAFRQQSGQPNRQYGGAGLGLAISKRLVEKMGGEITVKSTKGKGSTFTVSISHVEISKHDPKKKRTQEKIENIVFEKATVLIVDDVLSNIEAIESLLFSSGLTTLSAENGEIALEILNHTNPDIILLDIRMPGIDGYEVAKRIKNIPQKKKIPIIAFTASVLSTDRIKNSGHFEGCLFKPVNRSELLSEIAKYLKHTIDYVHEVPPQSSETKLDNIPNELKIKLPEIQNRLKKEFFPIWENIKDSLVLFSIEEFAQKLKTFSKEYNFEYLINYTDLILNDINMFELSSLEENLRKFPDIVESLSDFMNS